MLVYISFAEKKQLICIKPKIESVFQFVRFGFTFESSSGSTNKSFPDNNILMKDLSFEWTNDLIFIAIRTTRRHISLKVWMIVIIIFGKIAIRLFISEYLCKYIEISEIILQILENLVIINRIIFFCNFGQIQTLLRTLSNAKETLIQFLIEEIFSISFSVAKLSYISQNSRIILFLSN